MMKVREWSNGYFEKAIKSKLAVKQRARIVSFDTCK